MAFKIDDSFFYKTERTPETEEVIQASMATGAEAVRKEEKKRRYKTPETPEEFWANLKEFWPEIILMARDYLDLDEIDEEFNNILEVATKQLAAKDPKITKFLNSIWWAAPDNGFIFSNIGWNCLCDSCSESHILFDGNDGPEEE